MISYLARRLLVALLTIFVVVTISFFMVRLMPGNAESYLENQLIQQGGLSSAQIQERVNALLGIEPKAPLWKQYFQYLRDIVHGNLGHSMINPSTSVLHVVGNALPWTLFSVGVALLISFGLGVVGGTIMAAFADSFVGRFLTLVVSFLTAIPNYLIAIVLLYLIADRYHLLPSQGAYSVDTSPGFNLPFVGSVLSHSVLPIASYVITAWGGWALSMKGCVVNTLGADYVRAAESWGLRRRRVTQSYLGRNSMLPMVTSLALSLGFMVGGSVFIETYFSYPGMGFYLIQAVNSRDYSTMMGCFLVITVSVVVANLAVDLFYPLVDPRIVSPIGRKQSETDIDVGSGVVVGPGPVSATSGAAR